MAAAIHAAPAAAQSAPAARDDPLNVGRKGVQWVHDQPLDSLWNRIDERMQGALGSKDGLQQQIDRIGITFGAEVEVVEETVGAKDGNLVQAREVKFEDGRLSRLTPPPPAAAASAARGGGCPARARECRRRAGAHPSSSCPPPRGSSR